MADAIDALNRATEHKRKCTTALTLAKSDLSIFKRWLTTFNEEVVFIRNKRQEEKAAFDRKVDNFNYALRTIELARPIVDEWENNQGAFL